ncbi:hypothetical protein TNCV_3324511 [Trichonephila clavipes]|nr:hypothetical protein TNCV_3324511 [Trichonephila clavipes]
MIDTGEGKRCPFFLWSWSGILVWRCRTTRSSPNTTEEPLRREPDARLYVVAHISVVLPGHEFDPSTTKDPPCRAAMHVKSVES